VAKSRCLPFLRGDLKRGSGNQNLPSPLLRKEGEARRGLYKRFTTPPAPPLIRGGILPQLGRLNSKVI